MCVFVYIKSQNHTTSRLEALRAWVQLVTLALGAFEQVEIFPHVVHRVAVGVPRHADDRSARVEPLKSVFNVGCSPAPVLGLIGLTPA
jgi:hypothetical protein